MSKRGPYKSSKPKHDLTGQVFGWLTALSYVRGTYGPATRPAGWLCRCVCGIEKVIQTKLLLIHHTTSCGCRRRDVTRERNTTHGLSHTVEHNAWTRMIGRCENPNNAKYPRYGGRGIRVCLRWRHDFLAFLEDMGPRPSPRHSIERLNNDGDYCPDNCVWAIPIVQANNKSNNLCIEWQGKRRTISEWSRVTGIAAGTIKNRYHSDWPVDQILTKPIRPHRPYRS